MASCDFLLGLQAFSLLKDILNLMLPSVRTNLENHANFGCDPDLEEGLELSHHGMREDLAMAANPPVGRDGMMQPDLESPLKRET